MTADPWEDEGFVVEEHAGSLVRLTASGHGLETCEAAVGRYLERWPPQGYGTAFEAPRRDKGVFVALGTRYRSCGG
ncbi:MAG: hypothetical protein KDG89_06760 [Geminicoccaceae bacterium]|nr:hypothetical protein [Geminicoccaceae bacterium]